MDDIGKKGVGEVLNTVLYLEAPPRGTTPYVIFNRKGPTHAPFTYVA